MALLSDILAALELWPKWKAISALPERVTEIEKRLAALEAGAQGRQGPAAGDCPACRKPMVLVKEAPHPVFGVGGGKVHTLRCDPCGTTVDRDFIPGDGYR